MNVNQEYTSEKSCIKQIPAGFKIVDKHREGGE